MLNRAFSIFCLSFVLSACPAGAQAGDGRERAWMEEKPGQGISPGTTFRDEDGRQVMLKEAVKRPTIVSLVYLGCGSNCPVLLGGLSGALGGIDLDPQREYSLVTISFDERDTPQRARERKKNYMKAIGKPFPADSWKFLTGDRENIQRVTGELGFHFRREGNGFVHPFGLIVLSADGRVVRYLRGKTFSPFDLAMALTEASWKRPGLDAASLRLFCFSYDSFGQRYVFNLARVVGSVLLLSVTSFIFFFLLMRKRALKRSI